MTRHLLKPNGIWPRCTSIQVRVVAPLVLALLLSAAFPLGASAFVFVGARVNGGAMSVDFDQAVLLGAGDQVHFIGRGEPFEQISFGVEDPIAMQSYLVTVTADASGEFLYPGNIFSPIVVPSDGYLSYTFSNGQSMTLISRDLPVSSTITNYSTVQYMISEAAAIENLEIDQDILEYIRFTQNHGNDVTMSVFDWEAVERGASKVETATRSSLVENVSRMIGSPKNVVIFAIEGGQCAAGVAAAVGTGGAGAIVAAGMCAPLAAHITNEVGDVYIDRMENEGAIDHETAEVLRGTSDLMYAWVAIAGPTLVGNPLFVSDVILFADTTYEGGGHLLDAVTYAHANGVLEVESVWEQDGKQYKLIMYSEDMSSNSLHYDVNVSSNAIAPGGNVSANVAVRNESSILQHSLQIVAMLRSQDGSVVNRELLAFNEFSSSYYNNQIEVPNELGNYTLEFVVLYDGLNSVTVGSQNIAVVPPIQPVLSVSPDSLYFTSAQGQDPTEQYISIRNVGGGTLNWTAATSHPSVVVDPSSGSAPSSPRVTVHSSADAVGTHQASITITSSGSIGSPETISVSYTVNSNQGGNPGAVNADTYLDENFLQYVNGGKTYLRTGSSDLAHRYHSFIRFDLDDIDGADIASAALKLYCNHYGTPEAMRVARLTSSWSESDDGLALSDYTTSGTVYSRSNIGLGWEEWNVTNIVQAWADGSANVGLAVYTTVIDGGYNQFESSESTAGHPPILEITLCEGTPNLYISVPRPDNGATAPPFVVGQQINWQVTVSNQGTGCAPDYAVEYYLESSASSLLNEIGTDAGSPLLGGETQDETQRYTFATGDIGAAKYLIAHLRGTSRSGVYGPFEVRDNTPCNLAVAQPTDGTNWSAGDTTSIVWTSGNCGTYVRIELLRNSVPCQVIASMTENDGSCDYVVEQCGEEVDGYSVRVTDLLSGNSGTSAGQFAIRPRPFTTAAAGLPGIYYGDAVWGDYDGDGNLDVAVAGTVDAYTGVSISRVYHNDGQGHFSVAAELPGIWKAALAWGDFDNDGDLDLVVAGKSGEAYLSRIYRYDAGSFAEIGVADDALAGTWQGAAAWGDYDNDGDLDLVLTGSAGARIYRNDDRVFNATGDALMGADSGPATWVDYNRDGYLDLFLVPQFGAPRLYRNSGAVLADSGVSLPSLLFADAAWGDYDNDGYPELAISSLFSNMDACVFENNAGTIGGVVCELPGGAFGSVAWCDYDNDGDLDLAVTGKYTSNNYATRVYANENGAFVDIGAKLPNLAVSSVAWGDCDRNGKLDLLLSGTTGTSLVTEIFRNNTTSINAPPAAPNALQQIVNGDQVTMSWSSAIDGETPADGLSYNLRLGTTPGGCEIISPMADAASGARRIAALGNAQQRTSWTMTLAPGTYYWSVQAIDGAFAGSAFAPEQSFVVEQPGTAWSDVTPAAFTAVGANNGFAWGDYDSDGREDLVVAPVGQGPRLFRNDGSGSFSDVTEIATISIPAGDGMGVSWGDFDNDGHLDLYLARSWHANVLLRNDGSGHFENVSAAPVNDSYDGNETSWVDYDNDGLLDLFLVNVERPNLIFRNTGGGSFVTLPNADLGSSNIDVDAAWCDFDNDGDQDLFIGGPMNGFGRSHLIRNDGNGVFVDVTISAFGGTFYAMGGAWGDYDNDGNIDLYVSGGVTEFENRLYRNCGDGTFLRVISDMFAINALNSLGASWGDYDNDGDIDLFRQGSPGGQLLRNDGGGEFSDVTHAAMNVFGQGDWADYDNDGDLDLFVGHVNRLLRNNQTTGNHWLHVRPVGTASNRAAIGARLRVVCEGVAQVREVSGNSGWFSQGSLLVEFGLGSATVVDTLQVTWPYRLDHGQYHTSILTDVAVDRVLVLEETYVPGVSGAESDMPTEYALSGCRPNPFNPTTTIGFDLPRQSVVRLRVFDVSGRAVRDLVATQPMAPGRYERRWDGKDDSGRVVPSGIYFYRLDADGYHETKRMVLIK